MKRKQTTCENNSPAGWTDHWREWHRGHGCDKDPDAGRAAVLSRSQAMGEIIHQRIEHEIRRGACICPCHDTPRGPCRCSCGTETARADFNSETSELFAKRAKAAEDAYLRICQALGMAHEPEGQMPSPAPLDQVLTAVKELIEVAGLYQETAGKLDELAELRPRDEYHEDDGPVLWWKVPIAEPPYCGTALDDDFPDYVTHWSPLPPVRT